MDFPRTYTQQYPICSTPGPFIVVGLTVSADGTYVHSLDIHLDADDPNFSFENPNAWPELSSGLIEDYNRPYRKSHRLALRRATDARLSSELFAKKDRAEAYMMLTKLRRLEPKKVHTVRVGAATVGFFPKEVLDEQI